MHLIHVKLGRGGKWFWHRVAGNGEIVNSAQPYATKSNAVRAARAEKKRCRGKIIIDATPKRRTLCNARSGTH